MTTIPMRLIVDVGVTSHIIRDAKEFKNYDQSFQSDNYSMELADGTKKNSVVLKRGDAEVCRVNAAGNHVVVTLKKHYLSPPPDPQGVFSVKVATVIFMENKIKLKGGTKFKILVYKRLYN